MKPEIKLTAEQTNLVKRLRRSPVTSLQWAHETGSVKITTRISELRALGVPIRDKWITLKSGRRIKSYSI